MTKAIGKNWYEKNSNITGVTGHDGVCLAEFLLEKGYEVHGIKRRTSLFNTDRIDHLYQAPHELDQRFILHHGDMTESNGLSRIMPDRIRFQQTGWGTAQAAGCLAPE